MFVIGGCIVVFIEKFRMEQMIDLFIYVKGGWILVFIEKFRMEQMIDLWIYVSINLKKIKSCNNVLIDSREYFAFFEFILYRWVYDFIFTYLWILLFCKNH